MANLIDNIKRDFGEKGVKVFGDMLTILHNHTHNSIKDSSVTVSDFVKKGKELGYRALCLSDHGVLTGAYEFYKTCQKQGVLPVIGCEFYVKEQINTDEERKHLCVYAVDMPGLRALMKAVKLSNGRIEKVQTLIFPLCNEDILRQCFGQGSEGYGHVIATSACIGGVIAGIPAQQDGYRKDCQKWQELADRYTAALGRLDEAEKAANKYSEFVKQCKESAGATYSAEIKRIKQLQKENPAEAEKAMKALQEKQAFSAKCKAMYPELKEKQSAAAKRVTELKNSLPKKGDQAVQMIKTISEKIIPEEKVVSVMKEETRKYDELFGHNNFFIEIQYHGLSSEKRWMWELDKIAEEFGIPTCAANDAHMLDNSKESLLARETMTSLRFTKLEYLEEADKELYMKTPEQLFEAICQVLSPSRAARAMMGTCAIGYRCSKFKWEMAKHYPVFEKNVDGLSKEELKERAYNLLVSKCEAGIKRRFPDGGFDKVYKERLAYELRIMKQMGVEDYHLIVCDLLEFCRKLGFMPVDRFSYLEAHIWEMSYDEIMEYVNADQSYIGYTTGPGRGSSAGSLVCYLVGITDIDPIKYDLLFERFLNPERVTMPDIDSDYAYGYRSLVVVYTYKRYGYDAVCRIITYSTNSAKAILKDTAKAIGAARHQEKEYEALGEKLSKCIDAVPHAHIKDYADRTGQVIAEDARGAEVIERAKSVEGTYNHYGMHAAGVIISDNDNVNEYVPLSWDSTNRTWKCQVNKEEAEELGLLKMDYLGLRNLNIITEIFREVYKRHNRRIEPLRDIVEDPAVIHAICDGGNTNGVFQLESAGMKDICKRLKPDTFEDLILLVAAYRPGPMDDIPTIIDVKKGIKEVQYETPELAHILDVTYSKPIYQEQVQQIFRDLAGYSYGQADMVRRAMSKKKVDVLKSEKEAFINGDAARNIKGCVANGISAQAADNIFESLIPFASYAFNKSHAAAYARVSYMIMWLKVHYFIEFMAVSMKWASDEGRVLLINECREHGVNVCVPDINLAQSDFAIIDDHTIMYGLTSIKGIGNADDIMKDRNENGQYNSFNEFCMRTMLDKGTMECLIKAGAFDVFCTNRMAVTIAYGEISDLIAERKKLMKGIEINQKALEIVKSATGAEALARLTDAGYKCGKTAPSVQTVENKIKTGTDSLKEIEECIMSIGFSVSMSEDEIVKLQYEKDKLGIYLSGHPLNEFERGTKSLRINEITCEKWASVCGVITNLKMVGKLNNIAVFDLDDGTGIFPVIFFAEDYKKNMMKIQENAVVEISGPIKAKKTQKKNDDDEEASEEEIILQMQGRNVTELNRRMKSVIIESSNLYRDYEDMLDFEAPSDCNEKYRLKILETRTGEVRDTDIIVHSGILECYPGKII